MYRFVLPLFLLATVLTFPACDLFEDALPDVTFDVTAGEVIFDVSAEDEPGTFTITQEVPNDISAELDSEDIDDDRVEKIELKSVVIRVISPGNSVDLATFDRASVDVSTPGRAALTFAESDLTEISAEMAELDTRDVDLLDYLLATTVEYTLNLTTNDTIPEGVQVGITPEFEVTASPL